jgi:DNA-binding SARP family transcriptional activator
MGWRIASIAVTDPLAKPEEVEKGDAQAMRGTVEHDPTEHPPMRVITPGEFALERLVPTPSRTQDEPPRYTRVARSEWSNRGPAMALLKVLLCQANRRASRDELIEAIWPDHEAINAAHALDSAASVLRRHILRTLRSGGETIFKLPGQHRLWVDADVFLSLVTKAMRVECQGQNPMPLLEEACALARGEFLEDALEEDPADEDALCRLMILLVEQGRRQEALHLYQYAEDVLQEEQTEPAVYTRELARRIRQGMVLRERGERYTAAGVQTPSLAGRVVVSRDHGDSVGVKRVRLTIVRNPIPLKGMSLCERAHLTRLSSQELRYERNRYVGMRRQSQPLR